MINRIIGLLLLVLLYPFFLFISIIIYIDDGFPVFFRQKRIGRNNSKFIIYKFRTMKNGVPEIPTHLVKDPQQYYSRSGPFLRKFSIDELPQLINIIKGEMILLVHALLYTIRIIWLNFALRLAFMN
jgi:O-antigen biosynthesis protein WbqP